ncbi:MAG TPA: type II toxin-antitoxin system RelE/ParE family toxin [Kofleriaceae bacterium]|nr:type II toxin-antitoxin system RelE/ParE family toxin [Kofleriaceae bacterium]
MKPYRYHPAAERELDEAIEHDEAELPGRGLRLEQQIARLVLRLRRFSVSAPIWPGLDSVHEVRRAKVRRHPFLVVYMVHLDQLVILAVAHTKKKPGYWASRIDKATRTTPRRSKRKPARSTSQEKERAEQVSPPRSPQTFLPVFSPESLLADENTVSSTLSALTRAQRFELCRPAYKMEKYGLKPPPRADS